MKEYDALSPEYKQLVDELSDLEHKQWWSWTLVLEPEMPEAVIERWKKSRIPYSDLPESMKDFDRTWAICVLDILTKGMPKCRLCGYDSSEF